MTTSFDPDAYELEKLVPLLRKDLDLVTEIEQRIVVTNSPLDAERLRMDREHVQLQYARHRETHDTLQTRLGARSLPQSQQASALTEETKAQLAVLFANEAETRNAILAHMDSSEQNIVSRVVGQLSKEHGQQTLILLAAMDRISLSQQAEQQTLTELITGLNVAQKQIPADDTTTKEQAQEALRVLEDAKVGFKHKLVVSLPLIPGILKYDREMSLDAGVNLSNAYANLKKRLGFGAKDKDA